MSRLSPSPRSSISVRGSAGSVVERREQLEGLAHRHALGQLALLELDADERRGDGHGRVADRAPGTLIVPPSGVRRPAIDSTVVVLPAPFGSEDAEDLAFLDGEGDAVNGGAVAIALGEVVDFDDIHASRMRPASRRVTSDARLHPDDSSVDPGSTDRWIGAGRRRLPESVLVRPSTSVYCRRRRAQHGRPPNGRSCGKVGGRSRGQPLFRAGVHRPTMTPQPAADDRGGRTGNRPARQSFGHVFGMGGYRAAQSPQPGTREGGRYRW